jgi:hypothetical protein
VSKAAEALLPPIAVARCTGQERLRADGKPLSFTLLDFWQWTTSDLVSNVTRGRLAEFIVATALGVDVSGVRNEWDTFDLTDPCGLKIEVKSAAYVQSWGQARPSAITWRTPRTLAFDVSTGGYGTESRRHADVYVFALLDHRDKSTVDPLNVDQWCFFVVPTRVLDARTRSQHSITVASVKTVASPVSYSVLAAAVSAAGSAQRARADATDR